MNTADNPKNSHRFDTLAFIVRKINRLIISEKDTHVLLKNICSTLAESLGYNHVWIATSDEPGGFRSTYQSGLNETSSFVSNQMSNASSVNCITEALLTPEVFSIEKPSAACEHCPVSSAYKCMGVMSIRLEYAEKEYGVLSVSIPHDPFTLDEGQFLFREIANDVAFALHTRESEQGFHHKEELREQQIKELFAIVNALEGSVYVADMDTYEILAVNRYCEERYGPGLVGSICYEKLQENQNGPCPFCTNHLLIGDDGKPKPPVVWEFQNTKSGNWYHCVDRAIKWPTGGLVRMEIATNITEQKLSEQTLMQNEYQLTKRIKELNCIYGISRIVEKQDILFEEILQEIVDIIPAAWQYPEITCARINLIYNIFRTVNFKETAWKQDSHINVHGQRIGALEVFYLEQRPDVDEGPFQREERNLIDTIARRIGKIIERVTDQEGMQASEKRFRDLVENALTGILIIQEGHIIYTNPEQERLFGPFPRSFQMTEPLNIHPNDIARVRQSYQKVISGEKQTISTEFRFFQTSNGESEHHMKWVYCRASSIEYQGRGAILVNMMDITRIKELEHLLRIQDKMTSLGHVASGIAHEIRNPLSGINIYLSTLERMLDRGVDSQKTKEIIEQIKSASGKIESVVRRVMDFSKPTEPHFALMNINKPVGEAIDLSSVTLRKRGIRIETALDEKLPLCRADSHMIEEVILNLITNAIEAMRNIEGEKKIGICSSVCDNCIVIKVSDSGHGVPLDIGHRIFDPFYTTKDGNTGIGLSISHRIITDHGGRLNVVSSEWGGAEFVIEIPIERRKKQR